MSALVKQIKDFLENMQSGKSLFGLDIGLSAVKVCEMSHVKKNIYKLEKFASVPLTEAAIIENEIQKPEEIIEAIQKAVAAAGIKTKSVCLGLSGPNTVSKRLQVPDGSKEEMEDHIIWESEQYIPFGADDSELDFNVLGDNEGGGKDAIIAAAKIEVIENLQNLIKEAGFNVKVVDLNVFAVSNIFEGASGDKLAQYNEGTIVLDIGAQSTKVIIFKNNAPSFTKEVNWGGSLVTEEIQKVMGVSFDDAENLKINGDGSGNLPEEVSEIIKSKIDELVSDLKKVLNFYITPGSTEQAKYCLITGGSSLLPGMKETLQDLVGVSVEYFNPFENYPYNKKMNDEELMKIASVGVACMGLAIRSP